MLKLDQGSAPEVYELLDLLGDFYAPEQEVELIEVLEKYFRDKKNKQ